MKNFSKKYSGNLYCFSPPVMIATCTIEILLLIYTLWRYKFNKVVRLSVLMLFLLATFQLAEFRVCTGSSGILQWSHIGYVAITMLPVIGIHIVHTIAGKKRSPVVYFGYATAITFVVYFALTARSLVGDACLGNYVIFQINPGITWLYGLYYYGWVIVGGMLSVMYAQRMKNVAHKLALYGFTIGYATFLIPTTTANLLDKSTLRGIPSIMCGFAVLFALILIIWVMPRVGSLRQTTEEDGKPKISPKKS